MAVGSAGRAGDVADTIPVHLARRRGGSMKVAVPALVVSAAVAAATALGAQGTLARTYATVLNEQGGPVRGLQAADLVLRDGGIRQGVVDAEAAKEPLEVAVVVFGFGAGELVDVERAIDQGVRALRAENPSTQVGLVNAGSGPTMITPGQAEWHASLDRLASSPAGPSFIDVVIAGCEVLSAAPPDRRVVLGIVETHGAADINRPDRLSIAVNAGHVALWTVEVGAAGAAEWRPTVEAALNDAIRLGGSLRQPVKSRADVSTGVAAIVDFLSSQYLVTYGWPDPMLSQFSLVTRHDAGRVLTPAWSR
jgi:hypothetical protein